MVCGDAVEVVEERRANGDIADRQLDPLDWARVALHKRRPEKRKIFERRRQQQQPYAEMDEVADSSSAADSRACYRR